MDFKKFVTSVTLSLIATQVLATSNTISPVKKTEVKEIQVVGLFNNAAVLNIDNQHKLLRVGEVHRNVRLLAANSEKAMLEIKGKRYLLSMSDHKAIHIGLLSSGNAQAQLISSGGMFTITGMINQQLVDFVVDTGASFITMSPAHAHRLNLDYSRAKKIMVNTARGKTTAHVFNLKSVRVGAIELHNVQAAVVNELESSKMLLGMSFLGQVEIQQKNGVMILKKSS